MGDAHLDDAQHCKKRAEGEAKLDEIQHRFEALGQQQQVRNQELKYNGDDWYAVFRFAREQAQHGHVLAHRHGHARANPRHGADGRYQPEADQRADDTSAKRAEHMLAGYRRDVKLAGQFLHRRRGQKDRVEPNIENDHDCSTRQQCARQIAGGLAHLLDDIGGRIPAGIGIHHKHKADGERRAGDNSKVGGARRKRRRLRIADCETGDDEDCDEDQLEYGPGIMERAAKPYAAQMHQRGEPGYAEPEHQRRRLRRDGFEIAAKCHGGERNGRCKADRRRQPTGHKPERRMIDPAQKVVLPARSRQHGGQFGVAECPTDRHDSADDPQQEEREAGLYVGDLKSEAGKDADAHHVGDDDSRCRDT